jgi:hypothetical protein
MKIGEESRFHQKIELEKLMEVGLKIYGLLEKFLEELMEKIDWEETLYLTVLFTEELLEKMQLNT